MVNDSKRDKKQISANKCHGIEKNKTIGIDEEILRYNFQVHFVDLILVYL